MYLIQVQNEAEGEILAIMVKFRHQVGSLKIGIAVADGELTRKIGTVMDRLKVEQVGRALVGAWFRLSAHNNKIINKK